MTVFCEDCGNVHGSTRDKEPWRWCCVMAPREPGHKFVSRRYSPDPPYYRCEAVNTNGECPMFEPCRVLEQA